MFAWVFRTSQRLVRSWLDWLVRSILAFKVMDSILASTVHDRNSAGAPRNATRSSNISTYMFERDKRSTDVFQSRSLRKASTICLMATGLPLDLSVAFHTTAKPPCPRAAATSNEACTRTLPPVLLMQRWKEADRALDIEEEDKQSSRKALQKVRDTKKLT